MRILKLCAAFALIFLPILSGWAQHPEEYAVRSTIDQLFKGMEQGDSAMVRKVFAKQVTLATAYRDKEGNAVLVRESSIDDFVTAVGTPHPQTWFEEIWNVNIQLDGDFAQVWCNYAFYNGNTFSHCGVDAFQLHKDKNGWNIFHLADTRRKEGCVIPAEIQARHR